MELQSDRFTIAYARESDATRCALTKHRMGLNPVIAFTGREDYPFTVSYDADHSGDADRKSVV